MYNPEHLKAIVDKLPKRAGRVSRPYFVRADEEHPKGEWGKARIHVFHGSIEIGMYERNYPSFGAETFEPFELDDRWYALYSSDYTCTRLMTLPDCRDIGGEQPHSGGFCPVELYVPRYRSIISTSRRTGRTDEGWYFESAAEASDFENSRPESYFEYKLSPWKSLDVGFVAGCIWGDDSSWKLEVIDLSRTAEGVIQRSARFGHVEIAASMPLVAAVQLYRALPEPLRVKILREECRDIESGRRVDPYTDELLG